MRFILAVGLCSLLMGPTFSEVLYLENFDAGMPSDWYAPNGGWAWEDGHIVNTTTCGYQSCMPDIWAGGPEFSSYLVSFDLTLSGGNLELYIMAADQAEHEQGQTSAITIDTGIGDSNPVAKIWRTLPWPDADLLAEAYDPVFEFIAGITYRIKFGKYGDTIYYKKWPVDSPEPAGWLIQATDSICHSGYWGISFWHGYGILDNFIVESEEGVPTENKTWGGVKSMFR